TVEKHASQCFGIACPQLKNIAHFHATRRAQHSSTLRTAIPVLRRDNVVHDGCLIIAAVIRMPEVIASGIRASYKVGGLGNEIVDNDQHMLLAQPYGGGIAWL